MNFIVARLICLILGYVFGLFQTGYLYGKLVLGVDIRTQGSGNAGTTNVLRVLGKKAGLITYFGDALKAVVSSIVTILIFRNFDVNITLMILYSGLGVVLGHNFPFYMKFKGGKGIAATSGVIVSLFDWKFVVLGLLIFFLAAFISKYVSVASLSMVTAFFIEFIVFTKLGWIEISDSPSEVQWEGFVLVFIFMVLAYIQHRSNVLRLIKGQERKIGTKKEE